MTGRPEVRPRDSTRPWEAGVGPSEVDGQPPPSPRRRACTPASLLKYGTDLHSDPRSVYDGRCRRTGLDGSASILSTFRLARLDHIRNAARGRNISGGVPRVRAA